MSSSKPIVIAGAGIAGLAAALAVKRAGHTIRILERRSDNSEDGAGIQIGPNGTRALRSLGLFDAAAVHATTPASIEVMSGATGRALASFPLGAWIAERHGTPYWTLHRADLHAVLATTDLHVDCGAEVLGARNTETGVEIDTTAGTTIDAAALIGADGLWSATRGAVSAVNAPAATGRVAARAMIPSEDWPFAATRNAVGLWLAPTAHVVHYPVRAGRHINVVVITPGDTDDRQWSRDVAKDIMAGRIEMFAAPLRQALAQADAWRQWPIMSLPQLPSFVAGRIALVGDAAHPMVPYLAQGAVSALEDAVCLGKMLAHKDLNLAEALARYDVLRRPRAHRVTAAATRNGRIYHLGGIAAAARDAAFQVLPGSSFMRAYDWMYRDDV